MTGSGLAVVGTLSLFYTHIHTQDTKITLRLEPDCRFKRMCEAIRRERAKWSSSKMILGFVCMCLYVFQGRISLCIPEYPGTKKRKRK